MFAPHTFVAALIMTILSTICWGSFANTLKLTKNFRFELYYWSYAVGIVVISLVLGHTMGATDPHSPAFLPHNIHSVAAASLGYCALAGFVFNIANVLLLAGIEMAGLAVAFPLSIGIALVEGVVLSYAIEPRGSAMLLAAGVLLAVIAIILIGKAYGQLSGAGRAVGRKSIIVCIVSGILMGAWAPIVTAARQMDPAPTPYAIAIFFTLGAFICCFVFNTYLMKRPLIGTPLSFRDLAYQPFSYHILGFIGGCIWGVGTTFNLVAAGSLGMAIAYAIGQASPMIAAAWGVFVWHEFRGSSAKAKGYLAGMFASYILALVLIARAYNGA